LREIAIGGRRAKVPHMRIYYTKYPYFGGFANEPTPRWPQDYDLVAEMAQGTLPPLEALEQTFAAFNTPETLPRRMHPGDVVALDDGKLYRCEMTGWEHIGTLWAAKIQRESERHR
jgi:hypothetical protein